MRRHTSPTGLRQTLPIFTAFVLTVLAVGSAQGAEPKKTLEVHFACPKGFLSDLLKTPAVPSQKRLQELAIAYGAGHCQPESGLEAERQLQGAARRDHPVALFIVGLSYDTGNGYERNRNRAQVFYERAARRGNTLAKHYLGLNLLRLAKSHEDRQRGLQWIREAAGDGAVISAALLAQIHEFGRYGIAKDPCRAQQWYEIAMARGMAAAEVEARRLDQSYRCARLASRQ